MVNDFYLDVFKIVKLIPKGKVTSYGLIAKCLGSPQSSRMVGYAMNYSHQFDPSIPAHRVLNRNGCLTGKHHFPTETMMQDLLEAEGHIIENNCIKNLDKVLWNPAEAIEII
ncbi:MAG: MGMT family protein [Bacteroidales bacterium]|nr:MGMT family protein [Bacteroidales bacterium]